MRIFLASPGACEQGPTTAINSCLRLSAEDKVKKMTPGAQITGALIGPFTLLKGCAPDVGQSGEKFLLLLESSGGGLSP